MALEAQSTLKVSSALEVVGWWRRNSGHMSGDDRLSIKYLQIVNIYNDLVTVHSAWTEAVRRAIWTMFTNLLTTSINRPPEDHLRGHNVHLLLNPRVLRTIALRPLRLFLFPFARSP
jgi:hypothetical protein